MFYVYALIDPTTNKPFYIGKGSGARIRAHFTPGSLKTNTLKVTKIKSLLSAGVKPIAEYVAKNLSEDEAFELERFIISELGRIDLGTGFLTNHTDGGEGTSGAILKPKSKQAREHLRNIRTGTKASNETKAKLSTIRKGSGNSMAKTWILKDPFGNITHHHGTFYKFCKANNICANALVRNRGKAIEAPGPKYRVKSPELHSKRLNSIGWMLLS